MDCLDARRLIDEGMTPASHTPLQARLGFHLARCPACRSYQEAHTTRLTSLLEAPPASPPPPEEPASPPLATRPKRRARRLLGVAALLVLAVPVVALIWLGTMLLHTRQNIAAMVVTPVPTQTGDAVQQAATAMLSPTPEPPTTPTLPPSPTATPAPTVAPSVLPPVVSSATPQPTPVPNTPTRAPPPPPSPWPTIQVLPSPAPGAVPTTSTFAREFPLESTAPISPAIARADSAGDAVTILLLGHDLRPGEDDIPRTDAVMLVRVERDTSRIALLSLPRDLWVSIPGYGHDRINTAYRKGELRGPPGNGMAVARRTISNLLGIRIDYVALVGFEGFIGVIDALGGVTVNVETELYDAEFPTMDYGYTVAHFLPGPQHMDGITALTYSRTRHPDSDFMRIRRQQTMLVSIGRRLRERGDLQNLLAAEEITAALVGFVSTDMPQEEIVALIWSMRDFDTASVEHYTLGDEGVTSGVGTDRFALVPIRTVLDRRTLQFIGARSTAEE